MTALPASGYISNALRTEGEIKQALEDLLECVREGPGGAAETELTISAGSVTPTLAVHSIDTESDAATDDLANIDQTDHPDGRLLLIHAVDPARVVTVKHAAGGAGQVLLHGAADFVLDSPKKWLLLKRTGTTWEEVTRSFGDDTAAARAFLGAAALAAANIFTKTQTWARGAALGDGNIAAGILTLGSDGNSFDLSGTEDIAGVASVGVGTTVRVRCTSARTFTHHATNLICPGGVDLDVVAGDIVELEEYASADWVVVNHQGAPATDLTSRVKFDASDGSVLSSVNVASVVRNVAGRYTISWDKAYAGADAYVVEITIEATAVAKTFFKSIQKGGQLAGSVVVETTNSGGTLADPETVHVLARGLPA